MKILVLNCGSSSVKYELIEMVKEIDLARGYIERIGMHDAVLSHHVQNKEPSKIVVDVPDHNKAIELVIDTLIHPQHGVIKHKSEIKAVGHRVVHGGEKFSGSVLINDEVKKDIRECIELAPLHNPHNFRGINACEQLLPDIPQVAVFDTAFHQKMPSYAYIYALPYSLYKKYGLRRYGFHGTSHQYVAERAAQLLKKSIKKLKIITCHLGNGSSVAAINKGVSVDTSMGFTPLEGLVMGTRCGDIDPAIIIYLMGKEDFSLRDISSLLNNQSGLEGISGVSNDMREILDEINNSNKRALIALEVFTYRLKKYIAAYAGAMGGIDVVVFTAGIGENVPRVREMACSNLDFMGIKIDVSKNEKCIGKESDISSKDSRVKVFCIPTNEEIVIARDTARIIRKNPVRHDKVI